ncbi:MAG: DODA-type extradiol aromatic ring-opening family dioxygenase, partial [Tumebacillaceae bacterium]
YGEVEDNGGIVKMERAVDRQLARAIFNEARDANIPAGAVNFATAAGPYSCLPLDWGVIVPLHFMPDVPIVVITPSRFMEFADHIKLGEAISRVVQASGKRVAMIASCDWSHAHAEDGPYGYDPAAAELDAKVVELIQANDLEAMMDFDPAFVDAAKPDGIWQALILAGAIPREHRNVEWLSYEVPTYFGLMCAGYHNR